MNPGDEVICVYTPTALSLQEHFQYVLPMLQDEQWPLEGNTYTILDEVDKNHIVLFDKGFCKSGARYCYKKGSFVKVDLTPLLDIIKSH